MTTPEASEEIDLGAAAARLWVGRWWIIVCALIFTGLFVAVALLMTPIYRATAVIVPASSSEVGGLGSALGQFGGLASLAGLNIGGPDARSQEALAVLESREFTEAFIRQENILPELFANKWDATAQRWKGDQEKWPSFADGFKYFDRKVRVITRDRLTGLTSVAVEWKDANKAARWANLLIEKLNAAMRERAIANSTASMGYLEKELGSTVTIETRQSINRLMEAQINQRMLANVTQEYAFRFVDRALPPDPKDIVRPQRVLLIAAGPLVGMMLGIFLVLIFGARRPRPAS